MELIYSISCCLAGASILNKTLLCTQNNAMPALQVIEYTLLETVET